MRKCFIFILIVSIAKLNAQNLNLQWARAIGNTLEDRGNSIVADGLGNTFITGVFQGTVDFDPGAGVYTLSSNGNTDAFISKLDASGNFAWANKIGGLGNDEIFSVTTDALGNVLVTGNFANTVDFDPGPGTFTITSTGYNAFILKLDNLGNFLWAKSVSGSGASQGSVGYSIKTDSNNNVYSTGLFQATADFDVGPGTNTLVSAGFQDIFILKLDALGNFAWVKQIGGSNSDDGLSVTLDASGNIYTTGFFNGTVDFDPGVANSSIAGNGAYEIFVLKLDVSGNFVWAKSFGGSGMDEGKSIKVDASGNVYTTGFFSGVSDFDPGPLTYTLDAGTGLDIFISKLDASGNFVWAKQMVGSSSCEGNSISLDNAGNIYATGYFAGTVDFDPGAGTYTLLPAASMDIYVLKLNPSGNMVWAKQLGGTLNDIGNDIFVSSAGVIYCTGGFQGTGDFDPEAPVFNLVAASTNNHDVFVNKINELPNSLSHNGDENNFTLFPNPTSGNLKLQFKNKTAVIIKLINSIGQVLLEDSRLEASELNVDISTQTTGIYFLEIKIGKGTVTRKVIKD